MFKEIGSVFSFLTIFPSSNATLDNIAKYMFMFPIVGIAIGLLVGSFGFGLSFFLEPLLVSLLVVASIAIITGIHHADGLADFADGLMVKGKAMKDLSTGSAGIVTIVLYLIGLIITISLTSGFDLFKAILISEILAKFSMVLMASLGKSASLGSNSPFVEFMKDKKKLSASFLIMLIPVILIGETTGLIMLGVTIALTTNEFTRLASLMVFVSI
jgi:adenosylcobinamide-GDP ribazoletransferase